MTASSPTNTYKQLDFACLVIFAGQYFSAILEQKVNVEL